MGRKLALIIGNSQYEDAGLARLSAPDADVNALADVLRDTSIGAFDAVESIVNQSFAHTRRAIARFFDERKRDDLLLLYFSGHGVRDEYGQLHLAVRDTERSLLAATAIEAAFVSECMDRSASKRLVLVLDCCHSGAFGYGAKSAHGASVGTAVAFEGTGRGRVVLTATDATQFAWEGDTIVGEANPSLFTRHVTEGLRTGAADLDRDGIVTIDELYEYVYEQVLNDTAKQTPGKWAFGQQGEIVIARNPSVAVVHGDAPIVRPAIKNRVATDDRSEIAQPFVAAIEALIARARQPVGIATVLAVAAVVVIIALSGRPGPPVEPAASTPRTQDAPLEPTPAAVNSTPAVLPNPETKPVPNAVPPNSGRAGVSRRAGGAAPEVSKPAGPTTGVNATPVSEATPPRAAETPAPAPAAAEPPDNRALAAAFPLRPTTPVSAEAQIKNVLARYTEAHGGKDVDALKEIWPSVPVLSLRKAYGDIASQTVKLTNCSEPVPQGVVADVECNEEVSSKFTTGGGRTQRSRAKFSLRREGDHWVIGQISRRPL
jgi:hypothetical protein